MPSNSNPANGMEKTKKRLRAARACETCRAKKYKCDEQYPCTQCKKQKVECVYEDAENVHERIRAANYVAELERRVEELSAKVKRESNLSGTFQQSTPSQAGSLIQTKQYLTTDQPSLPVDPRLEPAAPPGQVSRHEPTFVDSDSEAIEETPDEVRDVNPHTRSVEFHGNTSSMAFLAMVAQQSQKQSERPSTGKPYGQRKSSLVSALHNPAFSPSSNVPSPSDQDLLQSDGYYFRQAQVFLDGYFENLHFIHPILNREVFFSRSEDLWFGRAERQPRSFVALYYSVLSLGALIRVWDEPRLGGLNRFQWSRKLFNCARIALGEMRSMNDLETVQTLFFMAKVCQNELNPHLAYIYLGMAVRASLSAGHNREPITQGASESTSESADEISKTWWGLYSLEMETSFALGRPDSLGMDEYHNRRLPKPQSTELEVLSCMIPFARITRRVSISIYLSKSSMREKISLANAIEADMDSWLSSLSQQIKPRSPSEEKRLRILNDPKWARRQRLVLQIRYHNVKMVLFRPFLLYASQCQRKLPAILEATMAKCVDAAKKTIEIIHEVFVFNVFFRTWWYNTTYVIYAASIVLCYAAQAAPLIERPALYRLAEMTVEILDAMSESIVAKKASEMIKQALAQARDQPPAQPMPQTREDPQKVFQYSENPPLTSLDSNMSAMLDTQMPSMSMDPMFSFDDSSLQMDESQFLFWTDLNDTFFGTGS